MWTLKAKGSKKDLSIIKKRFRSLNVVFELSEDKEMKKVTQKRTKVKKEL